MTSTGGAKHKRLDVLVGYCEAPDCRRMALLGYFGETIEPCGNCDVCLDPKATLDGTGRQADPVSDRSDGRAIRGCAYVLKGIASEKVVAAGHHRLSVFGSGSSRTRQVWRSLIRQLGAATFLKEDTRYGGPLDRNTRSRAAG